MNFLYTVLHFLSELLRKLCLATHQEWVWSFCTDEHSQHESAWVPCSHGLARLAFDIKVPARYR